MPLFYYNIYVNVSYLHNDQLKEKLGKHACKQTHRVEVILFFYFFSPYNQDSETQQLMKGVCL